MLFRKIASGEDQVFSYHSLLARITDQKPCERALSVRQANEVTKEFLEQFKAGDLVDVRTRHLGWTGPHKLLKYEIDPPNKGLKPAAHVEIEIDGKKLERLLIVGDQRIIRKHVTEEQKQRFTVKRVREATSSVA